MEKGANKFIVDFDNVISRDELVEMIDHALASVMMLPDHEDVNIHKQDIAQPLLILHQVLYDAKKLEQKRINAQHARLG